MQISLIYDRIFLIVILLGITSGCAGPFHSLTPEQIRTDLEAVRQAYYVPSLGVAEISLDQIRLYGPVGLGRLDKQLAVSADSWYQLGSCTKAMTATALARLVQDGALSWDSRLLEVFPALAPAAHPDYLDITLGDLASHQAGFYPASDMASLEELRDYTGTKTDYLTESLQTSGWIRRGRFLYSNSGYAVLGTVLERRTGHAYPAAMDKLLFKPLGVKAYFGFPKDIGAEQPWGYTAWWGVAAPAREQDQNIPVILDSAGIVSMPLRDVARFVQLHLRGLLGRDDAGFRSATIKQLHVPRVETGGPFEQTYASGWFIQRLNGETIHAHTGSAGNFYALMAINPARQKAIAVVTNVGTSAGDRVSHDIMERMLID